MKSIVELNNYFEKKSAGEILKYFSEQYSEESVFSSSFSIEDQVITYMIAESKSMTKIFTLDTGRLPYETYSLIDRTREHFNINIEIHFPNYESVEKMVCENGVNLFYKSIETRKLCCYVRKIEPLKRALANKKVWITGLRREQSVTRENLNIVEYDDNFKIIKVNPLISWTEKQVWDFINKHNIPFNQLYNKNYKSIGCAPCSRAVQEGGDVRDGRWWWENPDTKECGLHIKTN